MSRTVHVIQGLSAAGILNQALHLPRHEVLVNEDVLSCGPLPPFHSPGEWVRRREEYWNSVAPSKDEGPSNWELLESADALRKIESIVLWLGIGVAEQLLFAWMVQLLKLIESPAQIQVVQFPNTGSRFDNAWSLGLLNPVELRNHPPATTISPQGKDELERLWERVTSSDPGGLLSAISDESTLLPYSRSSLQSLVHRYPDTRTGLGRWELELLKKTREVGPKAARVIGYTIGDNFDADLVGDSYLFSRLRRLADPELSHPLIAMSGDSNIMRACDVVLTDAGESVLAGRANAVELNGIDDWILGVHLDSRSRPMWYRSEGTLIAR